MRTLFIVVLSLIFSSASGQSISDSEVRTKSGQSVKFSSLIQKDTIYIISFWATWCTPCIKELREISEVYDMMRDSFTLKLIAVSVDDSRSSTKVFPKVIGEGWTYEVVLDPNQNLAREMNVNNVPMVFIVNRKREIVYSHQGYSPGSIEEILTELDKIK